MKEKKRLSKFIRKYSYDDTDVLLYNTANKAITIIPQSAIDELSNLRLSCLSTGDIISLKEMGFLKADEDYISDLALSLRDETILRISIETTLNCNLGCPYCYQKNVVREDLSEKSISYLILYLEQVYTKSQFKVLNLKILGGEPTIKWNLFELICSAVYTFAKGKDIIINLLVDSNFIDITNILKINGFNSILLTIPLTHKTIHDEYRKDKFGNGTYDKIIENLKICQRNRSDISIVLRHNTDHTNIQLFEDYILDLKNKLLSAPLVSLNYTLNINKNSAINKLSFSDFTKWLTEAAIDILVKHNFKVTFSPIVANQKCQFFSKYSIKLFSDGTVGACAMSFFDDNRPTIKYLSENIEHITSYWKGAKAYEFMNEKDCLNCDSLFLCGIVNQQPCIKSVKETKCGRFGDFNVNIEEFLMKYMYYYNQSKEDLFVGFDNSETCQ